MYLYIELISWKDLENQLRLGISTLLSSPLFGHMVVQSVALSNKSVSLYLGHAQLQAVRWGCFCLHGWCSRAAFNAWQDDVRCSGGILHGK